MFFQVKLVFFISFSVPVKNKLGARDLLVLDSWQDNVYKNQGWTKNKLNIIEIYQTLKWPLNR